MFKERASIRPKAFLKATIRFPGRNTTMDCLVRNISPGGARLDVGHAVALPAEFELEIPQRGLTLQCALKWRNACAAGVSFKENGLRAGSISAQLGQAGRAYAGPQASRDVDHGIALKGIGRERRQTNS
jgi:hypothetical protein